ncbi:MAG: NmrA family NAD(P)-binding protein [Pseudomonadota bacterium]
MQNTPILIIGSTGKTGRRITQKLRALGHTVREGARQSPIPFDWDQPATWTAALEGVHSAYICYAPELAFPGAPEKLEALAQAAVRAGLRHVVLLSGRNESHAQRCEAKVQASGLGCTILRASWFSQNFSEGHLLHPVLEGVLALPAGNIQEPFLDADDIADVAVAALTEPHHRGRVYELTGPRLLSFDQAAAELSAATGRNVRYVPLTLDTFRAEMTPVVGPVLANMFTDLCEEVFDGRNACLATGVQEALGRAPRDFADYCKVTAATGIWRPAPVAV